MAYEDDWQGCFCALMSGSIFLLLNTVGIIHASNESAQACRHAAIREMKQVNRTRQRSVIWHDPDEASGCKISFQRQ